MNTKPIFRKVAALLSFSLLPFWVFAQNNYIYYNHAPFMDDKVRIGGYLTEKDKVKGAPSSELQIQKGASVCFVIDNPNLLLYSYKIVTKVVEDKPSQELNDFVKLLEPLLENLIAKGDDGDDYVQLIDKIAELNIKIEARKISSDSEADFSVVFAEMSENIKELKRKIGQANTQFEAMDVDEKKLKKGLQAYLKIIEERIGIIEKDLNATRVSLTSEYTLCVPVEKGVMKVYLIATRKVKLNKDETPVRPVDTLAVLTVRALDDQRYRFASGVLLSYPLGKGATSFAVENNLIVEKPVETDVSVPVMFQGRFKKSNTWGAIGVGMGGEKIIKNIFLGIIFDLGEAVGSPFSMTLGAGATFMTTATRLSKGKVGEALPADVKTIDDVIDKKLLPGFGVTFTIGALKLK